VLEIRGVRPPRILLQGPPKVGKTTVVERLVDRLRAAGCTVGGFLTRELREHDRRVGFAARDLDGPEAVIAHQDYVTGVQVGRFGVDVAAFERIALPSLRRSLEGDQIVIVDEIARMELASTEFVILLQKIMESRVTVIGTVHVQEHPVTDALLRRPDVEVIRVTEDNRDELPGRLAARLATR
jgi:nucleoside-triphosphatase